MCTCENDWSWKDPFFVKMWMRLQLCGGGMWNCIPALENILAVSWNVKKHTYFMSQTLHAHVFTQKIWKLVSIWLALECIKLKFMYKVVLYKLQLELWEPQLSLQGHGWSVVDWIQSDTKGQATDVPQHWKKSQQNCARWQKPDKNNSICYIYHA